MSGNGAGGSGNNHGCDGGNNNLSDNNELYDDEMLQIPVRRGSTDSKKITVKYESLYTFKILREFSPRSRVIILIFS